MSPGRRCGIALAVHGDILGQDLRYTVRTLNRSRGFAATAIAIVALGIGANTAAFSITDFVLLRPLPFFEPERLVTLWQNVRGYSRMELSPSNYRDWTQAATSFERIGAFTDISVNLVGTGEAGAAGWNGRHRDDVSNAWRAPGARPRVHRG